jgi:hypothetical protein
MTTPNDTTAPETWKPVYGYAELYEVSSVGRCRNRHGRVLTPKHHKGYAYYGLSKNAQRRNIFAHRLVLEAFVQVKPDASMVCRHLDSNPLNNHPSNLRWGTHAENVADAIATGQHRSCQINACRSRPRKLTEAQARTIKQDVRKLREIAADYGVSISAIHDIRTGRSWGWL